MPHYLCYGVDAEKLHDVSNALRLVTGVDGEPHQSLYHGDYDLFRIPEEVIVKFNYVEPEGEWDYPEHQDSQVLIVIDGTDRPDAVAGIIDALGLRTQLIESKSY